MHSACIGEMREQIVICSYLTDFKSIAIKQVGFIEVLFVKNSTDILVGLEQRISALPEPLPGT